VQRKGKERAGRAWRRLCVFGVGTRKWNRRDSENEQRGEGARGGCMTRRRERMRSAGFEDE